MTDHSDAVYNAIRSRFHGDFIGAFERTVSEAFDFSWAKERMVDNFARVMADMRTPSAIYRPEVYIDGDKWCALYGKDLQEGVAGFGDSPAEAMADFDKNWEQPLRSKP